MVTKWIISCGLLLFSGLSFGNVNCNNSTWDVAPGDPVVSIKGSDITVSYTFRSFNMNNGDGCLITHLSNQRSTASITSRDGKTVLQSLNSYEFGPRGGDPFFCYGTNASGSTGCANGFSGNVAPGSVSYNITNNIINSNTYVFNYKYKGTLSVDWMTCPVVEFMSRNGSISKFPIPCAKGAPTNPTCSLNVPSTLTMPKVTLDDFVLTGFRGSSTEAKGTSFNIRITCATQSTSFTPTVTFSYVEGVTCMPGNGATPATAAQNIGFAIKTSVTSSSASDYICGKSVSGTNFVTFPATTANAIYDQSKTLFVNYAKQGVQVTAGFVQTAVTLTATFN